MDGGLNSHLLRNEKLADENIFGKVVTAKDRIIFAAEKAGECGAFRAAKMMGSRGELRGELCGELNRGLEGAAIMWPAT